MGEDKEKNYSMHVNNSSGPQIDAKPYITIGLTYEIRNLFYSGILNRPRIEATAHMQRHHHLVQHNKDDRISVYLSLSQIFGGVGNWHSWRQMGCIYIKEKKIKKKKDKAWWGLVGVWTHRLPCLHHSIQYQIWIRDKLPRYLFQSFSHALLLVSSFAHT